MHQSHDANKPCKSEERQDCSNRDCVTDWDQWKLFREIPLTWKYKLHACKHLRVESSRRVFDFMFLSLLIEFLVSWQNGIIPANLRTFLADPRSGIWNQLIDPRSLFGDNCNRFFHSSRFSRELPTMSCNTWLSLKKISNQSRTNYAMWNTKYIPYSK